MMGDDRKWTPERIASLRRVIEAARAFVRCADEFVPRDGEHFYPDALGEYEDALELAQADDGRVWDGPCSDCPPPDRGYWPSGVGVRCGTCDRVVPFEQIALPPSIVQALALPAVDAFAAPGDNPGARVARFG